MSQPGTFSQDRKGQCKIFPCACKDEAVKTTLHCLRMLYLPKMVYFLPNFRFAQTPASDTPDSRDLHSLIGFALILVQKHTIGWKLFSPSSEIAHFTSIKATFSNIRHLAGRFEASVAERGNPTPVSLTFSLETGNVTAFAQIFAEVDRIA